MRHTLKCTSYEDIQAECTCGRWYYGKAGTLTQPEMIKIEEEFQRHCLQYATKKDIAPKE